MSGGKVEGVWLRTTVDYSYVKNGCYDVRHGECGEVTLYDSGVLKSLKVKDPSSDFALAVQTHLARVREFVQGRTLGSPRSVSSVRTEVCASVDTGGWFNDTQCQLIAEGNVAPEESVVAALFRGAQATVALLGPVGAGQNKVEEKPQTPAAEPTKGGTQATPNSLPSIDIDPMAGCKPGYRC